MRPFTAALAVSLVLSLTADAANLRNFDDAALHAVQFVDENEGWAVGDDGVVWHSIDGGQNWERQPTGTRASLRSVHFLSPYLGWIAGREELPHGQASVGVLLFTRDGGLKWQRLATNVFPGLNRVRFVDAKIGFLAGDSSDQFPTGIFRTLDGGRTWQPVPGPRCTTWLAADFQSAQDGALAGAWTRLGLLRNGEFGKADMEDILGGRAIRDLQVVGKRAVAVGQGALLLISSASAGRTWGYANPNLPTEVKASWDFHGVHCLGDEIWIVGRPGSAMLHSHDQGRSWEIVRTGQILPLNSVFFRSERHGWAVGELGSILNTTDGGKTWRVQHRGGERAAILFVHARPISLPVDAVAMVGGDDGYLAAGLRVVSSDPASASPNRAAESMRLSAAMRMAGGAAGEMLWQFPMPQHLARADKKELVQAWNPLHADRAAEEMLRQLVLAIRIWRPDVVVTDHPDAEVSGWPADALVCEALHAAFAGARDPKVFPEQLTSLGLEPWEVKKLYHRWDSPQGAQVKADLTQVSHRLEATFRDFATPPSSLLADTPIALPTVRFFHLLDSRIPGAGNQPELMRGVELMPGGVARRKLPPTTGLAQEVEKAIRTRRNLQALAELPPTELSDPNRMLAQVGPMLANMPDDQAAPAAFAVANQFVRVGQWTLARELFLLMVDRYPLHPLSADAYRWLIRHNSSSEARRRQELGQFWMFSQTQIAASPEHVQAESGMATPPLRTVNGEEAVRTNPARPPRMVGWTNLNTNREDVTHTNQLTMLSKEKETREWYQGSLDIGKRFAAFGPLYASEPSVQFCLQSAHRQLGEFDKAREWYNQFYREHADGPWRDAAGSELWLLDRNGMPPKPVVFCRQASARPFLDGDFKDACWQGLKPLALKNAVGDTVKDYPTEAWLAYDKDFLYVALRCRHPADRYVAPVKARPRDADLRPFDHVSLLLDLDRDYATYFRLEVDQRGCVCEDCWGDRSWNPRWFVALHSERDYWQIEAAIPMMELTGDTVTAGRAWACNIVRTLPGRGVQAWSLPAEVQPRPEGMGLLMFVPQQKAAAATSPHGN
ncbi:MAG TPA: YCF48-related protein [Gemmataceae bacterium]|nr:YCF48-related protein [Gemmataceae bacterium]